MRVLGRGPLRIFGGQVLGHPQEVRTEQIALLAREPKARLLVQPDSRSQEGCRCEHQPPIVLWRRKLLDRPEEACPDALTSSGRVDRHAPDVELTRAGNYGDRPQQHLILPLRDPDGAFQKPVRDLVGRGRRRRERRARVQAFKGGERRPQRGGDGMGVARSREA
jgi:hypothetical protein